MSDRAKKALDRALMIPITTPCAYHPAGRNQLLLSPLERQVVIERVEKILKEEA